VEAGTAAAQQILVVQGFVCLSFEVLVVAVSCGCGHILVIFWCFIPVFGQLLLSL